MPSSVHMEDRPMADAEPQQSQEEREQQENENLFEINEAKITVLPGATETAASFQFDNEGHTLGNALRYVIMRNPAVEFCGYTIPHPSEPKMNLRIQTYEDTTAIDALEKGLDDLMGLCDVVTEKFTASRDAYNASQEERMNL